jgi:hypothetical protein
MAEEANEAESAMTYYNISKIAEDASSKTSKVLSEAGMERPVINDMEEMRKVERTTDSRSSIARDSRRGEKSRRSAKAGLSFKKFCKSLEQEANADNWGEAEKYDKEGDACGQSVVDLVAPSSAAGRMTSRERREMRARELLTEIGK